MLSLFFYVFEFFFSLLLTPGRGMAALQPALHVLPDKGSKKEERVARREGTAASGVAWGG